MPLIKILPVELRNKIAAGEVIERPASVVKELVENSIDAESTDIKIDILRGGKGLIKVTDNGMGMDREDALLCLQPHATSKLKSEADLFDIRTMGFRGEALPSIASVSKIKLVTGLKNADSGVLIEIHGGEIKETHDFPSLGTSIEARDLFFNTPARKKFLKSDNTELMHIIDSVTKEALSHWNTGFILFTDGHETMNLPISSGERERIIQVYGHEFVKGLTEIKAGGQGLNMTAFITTGENFRNSRTHQFIFINRRPIKDQAISQAVYKAFEGILPKDRHPVFFIYLDINPGKVDFNVHPTKREVRFENKDEVYRFVHSNARKAIKKERAEYAVQFTEGHEPGVNTYSLPAGHAASFQPVSENLEFMYRPSLPFIYLGDTFIAISGKGGLTLLDHHAAHERILYEGLLNSINLNSFQMLFPEQVKLSHKEYRVIMDKRHLFNDMGIEIDDFGHDTVLVRSIPAALKDADLRGIMSDVASSLAEGAGPSSRIKESVASRIACHSSVRGRDILHQEELQRLLSDLDKAENPDQCPHGRPTRIFFSLEDLKKMFKRK